MSAKKTGSEVLAYCGSCKMDLMAVILAMNGASIARVQCKTCKGERAYRAPKGVKEPGAAGTVSSTTTRKTAPKAKEPEPRGVPVAIEWKRLLDDAVAKKNRRITYIPKETFILGDIVDHPSFGPGIVTKLHFPNKAEIIFQNDVKLLVHSLGK